MTSHAIRIVSQWSYSHYSIFDEQLAHLYLCLTAVPALHEAAAVAIDAHPIHYDLILDVSGSMNMSSKYPIMIGSIAEFARNLESNQTVSIYTFSNKSAMILDSLSGEDCYKSLLNIDQHMRQAENFFGGRTLLAPALMLCASGEDSRKRTNNQRKRCLILTDGELHDPEEAREQVGNLGARGYEVDLYGFGHEFNAEQLWHIIQHVNGATAKALTDVAQATYTFGHWARQGNRTILHNVQMLVNFDENVICGDAFMTEPIERELNGLDNGYQHKIASIEWNRSYNFIFEIRIPPGRLTEACIGSVSLTEINSGQPLISQDITVSRQSEMGIGNEDVLRIVTAFINRDQGKEAQVRSLSAKLELYRRQGRSSSIIEALQAKLRELETDGREVISADQEKELWSDIASERTVPHRRPS